MRISNTSVGHEHVGEGLLAGRRVQEIATTKVPIHPPAVERAEQASIYSSLIQRPIAVP